MWWSIPTAFIFLAPATSAERRLPTDVQVDLLFPRNETYAPAPWFPIIFAIRNLDAAWPLDVDLQVDVFSVGSRRNQTQHVSWQDIGLYSVPTPERHYFHMPAINMIEGATDRYNIVWRLRIWNRMQNLSFSTAPGAMLPDVETSIASCPEPSERSSAAVRILKVRESSADGGRPCPVMEDIPPEKCIYRPLAKQLAGSVKTILDQKLCAADARQTTSAPCQRLSVGASPVVTSWSWMGWALVALASAAWV
uniref:DUF7136 domain-containing protein n=1 Tax=Pyricularia oryzae (strain 70-15 / ATCC MYA-4617 / FGSC 8958) TaxID=242507 RepID=Q2KF50_PYRO7|nr:hypothetical protein MGCH7_ch7g836 [Pyricularia oryzae 70-15]